MRRLLNKVDVVIFDTGCSFTDEGETYFVLASDVDHFNSKEYETLLRKFSFGTYKKTHTRRQLPNAMRLKHKKTQGGSL